MLTNANFAGSANKDLEMFIQQLQCLLFKMQYSANYTQQIMSAKGGGTLNPSHFVPQPQNWKQPKLYKTTLCDYWSMKRRCKYGDRCWFAHGTQEMRYAGGDELLLGSTSTNSLC